MFNILYFQAPMTMVRVFAGAADGVFSAWDLIKDCIK